MAVVEAAHAPSAEYDDDIACGVSLGEQFILMGSQHLRMLLVRARTT